MPNEAEPGNTCDFGAGVRGREKKTPRCGYRKRKRMTFISLVGCLFVWRGGFSRVCGAGACWCGCDGEMHSTDTVCEIGFRRSTIVVALLGSKRTDHIIRALRLAFYNIVLTYWKTCFYWLQFLIEDNQICDMKIMQLLFNILSVIVSNFFNLVVKNSL